MPPVNKNRRAARKKPRNTGGIFEQVLVPLNVADHSDDGSDVPDWGDEEDGGWDSQVEEQQQRRRLLPSLGLEWVTNSDGKI